MSASGLKSLLLKVYAVSVREDIREIIDKSRRMCEESRKLIKRVRNVPEDGRTSIVQENILYLKKQRKLWERENRGSLNNS